jgi:hypothetical protein
MGGCGQGQPDGTAALAGHHGYGGSRAAHDRAAHHAVSGGLGPGHPGHPVGGKPHHHSDADQRRQEHVVHSACVRHARRHNCGSGPAGRITG